MKFSYDVIKERTDDETGDAILDQPVSPVEAIQAQTAELKTQIATMGKKLTQSIGWLIAGIFALAIMYLK